MIFQNCLKFTYNNFEISLVVFMPNITTNHATTYTNKASKLRERVRAFFLQLNIVVIELSVLLKWVSVKTSLTVVRLRWFSCIFCDAMLVKETK